MRLRLKTGRQQERRNSVPWIGFFTVNGYHALYWRVAFSEMPPGFVIVSTRVLLPMQVFKVSVCRCAGDFGLVITGYRKITQLTKLFAGNKQ